MAKKPKFLPFDHTSGLEMFDEEFICKSSSYVNLPTCSMEELQRQIEELQEAIADYDTIIEIELDSTYCDLESLKNDRRRRQQLVNELRQTKKQMKMMRKNEKELIAS